MPVGTRTTNCRENSASRAAATSHNWITTSKAMRTSTAEKRIDPCCRVSTLHLDARRHEIGAALLDDNARQAPSRRPRQWESFARGERTLVAGAGQHLVAGPVDDGAGQVGAHLRERVDTSRRVTHQNARVLVGRIAEQ